MKTREFSRIPGWLSLITGILWIPNFFFNEIGFKLLLPIYLTTCGISTVWIAVGLLRQKQPQPAAKEMAAAG